MQPRSQGLSSSRSLGREEERPWERVCSIMTHSIVNIYFGLFLEILKLVQLKKKKKKLSIGLYINEVVQLKRQISKP